MAIRDWFRKPDSSDAFNEERDYPFQQWINDAFMTFNGMTYPVTTANSATGYELGSGLQGYVNSMLKSNGIVYTCMALRMRIFSDIRFGFRELADGKPGSVTGDIDGRNPASRGLKLLANPEPGQTTGDLLARMIHSVDVGGGNAFVVRQAGALKVLRPDWVTVVIGSDREDATPWDLDAEVGGYFYQEGGPQKNKTPVFLPPETVAHWAPDPDPLNPRLGISWLQSVIREVMSDSAATSHKLAFFQNDATVNQAIEFNENTSKEMYEYARDSFKENHEGVRNAYKTLFLLNAKFHAIGTDFKQMDFTAVQGRGETRIAAASGLGPVLTHLSEGLQGSALNSGNYNADRRAVADTLFRPLWRNLCGTLAHIIDTPPNKELWYFDKDCMFLQEDGKDAAEIIQIQANTIANLAKEGFDPDSARDGVLAGDLSLLEHSGLLSVQLRPPGSKDEPLPGMSMTPDPNQPTNGKASLPAGQASGG